MPDRKKQLRNRSRDGVNDRSEYGYGYLPNYGFHPGYFSYFNTYPQEHPATLNDDDIRDRIYDALDNHPAVPETAEIKVNVQDRVVTLSGMVRSKNTKCAAWSAAWSVPGVNDVNNNLKIVGRRHLISESAESH